MKFYSNTFEKQVYNEKGIMTQFIAVTDMVSCCLWRLLKSVVFY